MTRNRASFLIAATVYALLGFTSTAAFAQINENRALSERLDRLERDISVVQRQVARGDVGDMPEDYNAAPTSAQNTAGLDALHEEIRALRGKLEENQFQIKRLQSALEKQQQDNEFRLHALEEATAKAAAAPPKAAETESEAASDEAFSKEADALKKQPNAGKNELDKEDKGDTNAPHALYSKAFRALNKSQYDVAAKHFKSFIDQYPKDPLLGNAYYWWGETFYIKQDYVKAADTFRQGYEAMPKGPKAGDNLLKLSMSLSALNKDKEACVVLGQVMTRFKDASTTIVKKAKDEQGRIGCK